MIEITNQMDREAVSEELMKIVSSTSFVQADRLTALLSYIVDASFDPERRAITQFDIAVDVYGRDDGFDPALDSLVRVEASRLRGKLATYYADEGADDPIRIELPKGGYVARFNRQQSGLDSDDVGDVSAGTPQIYRWAAIALSVMAIFALVYFLVFREPAQSPIKDNIDIPTVAILPFDNLSEDAGQEYFSDGIAEDIITDLSILSGLRIIARTSSFAYKGSNTGIRQISKELGASHILEGSVRRSGDQLRITAQLIDAENEAHIWAERYDRDIGEIFDVQDDVSRRIVDALKIALVGAESQRFGLRTTRDVEAYDLLLRAKEQFYRFDKTGVTTAIELLSKAIERDDNFAEAHAWKSRAQTYAFLSGIASEKKAALKSSLTHAQTAVDLAPQLAITHANLAWAKQWAGDSQAALTAIEKSVALNPNFSDAMLWQSLILSSVARGSDALTAINKSNRLNPNYGVTSIFARGRAYFELDNYEKALENFDRGIERNPSFLPTHVYRLALLEVTGDDEAAQRERDVLRAINPNYENSESYRFYVENVKNRKAR